MTKKSHNLLFLFLFIIFFTVVGLINYFADSHKIFAQKNFFDIFGVNKKYFNLYMDQYKNYKNEELFVGSSEAYTMFVLLSSKNFFNLISTQFVDYKELYEILKYYLKLHPETKKVVFLICYTSFYYDSSKDKYNPNDVNLFKQKMEMLFSLQTINSIISDFFGRFFNRPDFVRFDYFPYSIDAMYTYDESFKEEEKESLYYSDKIINLFKENNIEYELIIPPYNAIHIALLYTSKDYYNTVNTVKKFFCKFGPIYDYSRINTFTKQNLLDNTNYSYFNPSHPNVHWGYKLYKNIINNHSDNDLYYKLTCENIDEITQKEEVNIKKYILENKKYFDFYLDIEKNISSDLALIGRVINDKNIPQNVKDDELYIDSLLNKHVINNKVK